VIGEKEILDEAGLSPVSLSHLETLCDYVGLRQHAIHGVPLLESGYTTDDNARALVAMIDYGGLFGRETVMPLCLRFLSFLNHMQFESGVFRNLLSFDRRFMDEGESLDCFGRAVWACGKAANSWLPVNQRTIAKKMLEKAVPNILRLEEPRPAALAILGLGELAKATGEQRYVWAISLLAKRLTGLFGGNASGKWQWFEDILTYDNARLPHAMFAAFRATGSGRFLEVAEKSFAFLSENTFEDGIFVPVGQDGWFRKGSKKALFDQQPIEAASMVQAGFEGFLSTGSVKYRETAVASFNWFFGGNKLGATLYDPETGACFDGLTPKEPNLNQGAESLVEFLLARLCMEKLERQKL